MARLSVNLNKVALLRNSRHTGVPDLLTFARLALDGGSRGITIHPRPDERHIRGSDVPAISEWMKPLRPAIELNIEGYPDERFLEIVAAARPEQCTLVPDTPAAFTSEKGWDLDDEQIPLLRSAMAALKKIGTRIILFVDPDFSAFAELQKLGADGVEIYTGSYAAAFRAGDYEQELKKIAETAERARTCSLIVNVGHDLDLKNLPLLMASVPFVSEASIGHELTADALALGFRAAVCAYANALARFDERRADASFNETTADADPLGQFRTWFKEASALSYSNAMILATATKKGMPSARVVLLKQFDEKGFVFYTNYESRKSRELAQNPHAALVFHWPEMERQVRIAGKVSKTSSAQSTDYFHTRPRESQLGAWASAQSAIIESREALDKKVEMLREKYEGKEIPLPPHWGGFCLIPETYEFWHQGNPGRLHDRLYYQKQRDSAWSLVRLAP